MPSHCLLIALDSVGVDPLGHDRPESVYSESQFLFPCGTRETPLPVACGDWRGTLVATTVADEDEPGAIECAITYTSIFSGHSALREHGLMRGLGLKDRALEALVSRRNLFQQFSNPCLANAIFPAHLEFLGESYARALVPSFTRAAVEAGLTFQGRPISFRGADKNGFAELFTLAEINQNIFVYAAREAGVRLRTWADVRAGDALTSSLTHELENAFDLTFFDQPPLPARTPDEAAQVLAALTRQHDFTFYKYQIPDLVSHTGRVEEARAVFATIEQFAAAVLESLNPRDTRVIITSDHGHLEQLSTSRGHPKSQVPTWCFGNGAAELAPQLGRPEGIFGALCGAESPVTARA